MLSPVDTTPVGKAASVWSFDSGYGSNTLEEDESLQVYNYIANTEFWTTIDTLQPCIEQSSSTVKPYDDQPIGLGISNLWTVHVEDQLRLRKPEQPIDLITTRFNVFTVKASSTEGLGFPFTTNDESTCVTCRLWAITSPGEGLRCEACKNKGFFSPSALHSFDTKRKGNSLVPRLAIPHDTRPKQPSNGRSKARCSACDLAQTIDPSTTTCHSCTPDLNLVSPSSPIPESTVRRSCARRIAKLPPNAIQHLRAWLVANREHPYPNADTKRTLAQDCGITEKQVTTWFTNTRARKLAHDRSIASSDDEGAYESDYSHMAATPMYTSPAIGCGLASAYHPNPSTLAMVVNHADPLTLQTSRRGKKKDYRRVNTISPVEEPQLPRTPATLSPNPGAIGQETWQCTFCSQHLVPKSWRRHEETQHRPKHQWICLATGPRLETTSRTGTTTMCAFCSIENPAADHFDRYHRITECMKKKEADRTFGRPDHLRQHIKNFHKASLLDQIREKWRRDGPGKNVDEGWTCGFCKAELKTWNIRETHIANHFKTGLTMASWQHELAQPTPPIAQNVRRRPSPSQDIHTTMFSRLQRRLTGRSNRQHDYFASPPAQFANAFDPLPSSSRCANITPAPVLPDMGYGGYIPGFMGAFDLSGAPLVDHFGATYPLDNNAYGVYQGEEGLQLDYDALANEYANLDGGYNGAWDGVRR